MLICLAGTESYAIVEYAPYQKVPGEKKKPDSRHATIEKGAAKIGINASSSNSLHRRRLHLIH